MHDRLFEQLSCLKLELIKLDNAYVVGNAYQTIKNLGIKVEELPEEVLEQEYYKVAKRIYELQSLLNQDNCQ